MQQLNTSQQRLLRVQGILMGTQDLEGAYKVHRVRDIAAELGESETSIVRDLKNLEVAGWAMQGTNGWQIGHVTLRLRNAIHQHLKQKLTKAATEAMEGV
ncbi:MAG: hypothetical protein AAGJ35_10475 [Myxococcota bacterium]